MVIDYKILRLPQVKSKTGLPTSGIYRRISDGSFPKQVGLGGRSVGWLESDINNWIRQQLETSRRVAI